MITKLTAFSQTDANQTNSQTILARQQIHKNISAQNKPWKSNISTAVTE